ERLGVQKLDLASLAARFAAGLAIEGRVSPIHPDPQGLPGLTPLEPEAPPGVAPIDLPREPWLVALGSGQPLLGDGLTSPCEGLQRAQGILLLANDAFGIALRRA